MTLRTRNHWGAHNPAATHWRKATCAEVDCEQYLNGWRTIVPAGSDSDLWLEHHSGRHFIRNVVPQPDGARLAEYVFAPGQQCFRGQAGEHKLPLHRPPILTHRLTARPLIRLAPNEFVDRMGEHLIRIKREIGNG